VPGPVERGDLDELVREVDRLCARRDWDGLVRLRDRCRDAHQARGRQLWPIASHAEHRLALEAPALWAAAVLVPDAGHLGLGPLAEVAASTHRWADLVPHAPAGPVAALAAAERVVRGEPVQEDTVPGRGLDVALLEPVAPWEPAYPLATYTSHEVTAPRPDLPPLTPDTGPAPADAVVVPGDDGAAALAEVVRHWATGSDGRVAAVAVEGDAAAAVAGLGAPPGPVPTGEVSPLGPVPRGEGAPAGPVRWGELAPAAALGLVAWAAASGGAHGRRRGAARGRFDAWWVTAALTGLGWDPRPRADELGAAVGELRWWWWDTSGPDTGWALRLAVEDPLDGLAWALTATDA